MIAITSIVVIVFDTIKMADRARALSQRLDMDVYRIVFVFMPSCQRTTSVDIS